MITFALVRYGTPWALNFFEPYLVSRGIDVQKVNKLIEDSSLDLDQKLFLKTNNLIKAILQMIKNLN